MLIVSYLNHQWIPTSDLLSQLVGIVIQAITVIVVAVSKYILRKALELNIL
jgi:hypothetical protein